MKVSDPKALSSREGSASWLWACASLLFLLLLLLVTSWIPLPGLSRRSPEQGAEEPQLLRLRHRLDRSGTSLTLPAAGPVGEEGRRLPIALEADRFHRLVLSGRGDAAALVLTWTARRKNGGERRREVSVPIPPSGEVRRLKIPVSSRASWRGAITALELRAVGGTFRIDRLEAELAARAVPSLALEGQAMPAFLAGNSYRIPLPASEDAVFEAALGLLPGATGEGGKVRFRAVLETPAGERIWVDRTRSAAPADEVSRWLPLRRRVSVPPGSRLRLEMAGDAALAARAFWGNPLVVPAPGVARRDLVVVVVDTLRADVLGSYGGEEGLTPNLDRLARESLRLADLRAPSPWTLPSVASLMTGLNPAVHGAGNARQQAIPQGLPAGFTTLAEVLAGKGFYNAGVYNNVFLAPAFGLDQGFDRYEYLEAEDEELVDRALEILEETRDRRLFLFLHLFGPHNPYQPPEDDCRRATAELVDPGLGCFGDRHPRRVPPEERPWLEALYRAEVAQTDAQLGRLLEALALRPGGEPLLLVVSDHGEDFWARQEHLARGAYEPDADHGHHYFRELLHVPGLLRLPGGLGDVSPGVYQGPALLQDLFPTLLEAAGRLDGEARPLPGRQQGQSLLPLLRGQPPRPRLQLYGPLLYGSPRWAVRKGPWKLVHGRGTPPELYHLEDDPEERRDLAEARPDVVDSLLRLAHRHRQAAARLRRSLLGPEEGLPTESLGWKQLQRLQSLGYVR